jgi:hypothetical protein
MSVDVRVGCEQRALTAWSGPRSAASAVAAKPRSTPCETGRAKPAAQGGHDKTAPGAVFMASAMHALAIREDPMKAVPGEDEENHGSIHLHD